MRSSGPVELYGAKRAILEDADRKPLTYNQIVLAAMVLGAKIAARSRRGEALGVLLPNASGVAITLFSLNAYGRVAALLNFTSGAKNLRSALLTAKVRTVLHLAPVRRRSEARGYRLPPR